MKTIKPNYIKVSQTKGNIKETKMNGLVWSIIGMRDSYHHDSSVFNTDTF